jgi:hypothetical protein
LPSRSLLAIGPEMIEGAHPDGLEAMAEPSLQRQFVGRDLAGGVWGHGAERSLFVDGELVDRDLAVDVGAADSEYAGSTSGNAGLQQVERALGVDPECLEWMIPGRADVTPSTEVVDDIGPNVGDDLVHRGGIEEVGTVGAIDANHCVALVEEVRAQVSTDEPGCAGDERPHVVMSIPRDGRPGNNPGSGCRV